MNKITMKIKIYEAPFDEALARVSRATVYLNDNWALAKKPKEQILEKFTSKMWKDLVRIMETYDQDKFIHIWINSINDDYVSFGLDW